MAKPLYQTKARQATWLELFFDLVFVAVMGVITHDLGHTHHHHISYVQLLRLPLIFIPVWWIWATHTLYANRFDTDDRRHRIFTLLIMGMLVAMSTVAENSHSSTFVAYTLLYALIRLMLAYFYLRVHAKQGQHVNFAKHMAMAIILGAIISATAVIFSGVTRFVIFYTGIVIDILYQNLLHHKTMRFPVDRKHLVERTGLLVIIMLGESVISIVSGLSKPVWDTHAVVAAISGLSMVWAIWWIYFDSFNNLERARRITDGNTLIYTHLVFYMGLLILANLIGHSIKSDLDRTTFRMLAITGMSGFYFGKQIIYMVCFPPFRTMIVINTVVCLSITVASTFLPRIEYALIGMTIGMLFYVYSTIRWLLVHNIDVYLTAES